MKPDDQFLADMGLNNLSEEQKQKALDSILYVLNVNFARRVSELLNEEQLEEFDRLTDSEDNFNSPELAQWLEKNVPSYNQIIEEEIKKMKDENDKLVEKVMT